MDRYLSAGKLWPATHDGPPVRHDRAIPDTVSTIFDARRAMSFPLGDDQFFMVVAVHE